MTKLPNQKEEIQEHNFWMFDSYFLFTYTDLKMNKNQTTAFPPQHFVIDSLQIS